MAPSQTGLTAMNIPLRIATLSLAAAIGLTAAPTRAADATLGRDQRAVPVSGAEGWMLRPTKVTAAVALLQPFERSIPLSDLPAERRKVRIVYQGYSETAAPSAAR